MSRSARKTSASWRILNASLARSSLLLSLNAVPRAWNTSAASSSRSILCNASAAWWTRLKTSELSIPSASQANVFALNCSKSLSSPLAIACTLKPKRMDFPCCAICGSRSTESCLAKSITSCLTPGEFIPHNPSSELIFFPTANRRCESVACSSSIILLLASRTAWVMIIASSPVDG